MPGRAVCRTYGALEKGARHPSRLRLNSRQPPRFEAQGEGVHAHYVLPRIAVQARHAGSLKSISSITSDFWTPKWLASRPCVS